MSDVTETSIYDDLSAERKQMQKDGTLPEWFTTPGWQIFKQKYLFQADTFKEQVERICLTLAKHTDDPDKWYDKFYEIVWNGWLALSTPVMCNTGTERGLPVSCAGSFVEDSVEGFFDAYKETAILSKHGFGTSAYISDIRPRGSAFGLDGIADGVVPVVQGLTATIRQIRQTSRRGAGSWYIDIEHADFDELCVYMKDNPDDLNIGWIIKDGFIEALVSGNEEANRRYSKALQTKLMTGKGYFCFVDKINRSTTESIKNSGITIKASNLCIAGDQRVPSQFGYLTAEELYKIGEELVLTDGFENVNSSRMKLRQTNADVYKVTLENGMSLSATSYHGFPVMEVKPNANNIIVRKELKDLNILSDKIAIQTESGIFGPTDMKDEAFLLGQYQSDGTQYKDKIHLCLWENDFDLKEEIQSKFNSIHYKYNCDTYSIKNQFGETKGVRSLKPAQFVENHTGQSEIKKISLVSRTLKKALNFEKGYIPDWIWSANEETHWEYLRGLLYADGAVSLSKSKGNPIQVAYTDINFSFLQELQMLMSNLGLQCSIKVSRESCDAMLPDGRGGKKLYKTKKAYRLIVGNKKDALSIEKHTGFLSRKGIELEDREYRNNTKKAYKISSIEYVGKMDVYCPTINNDEHIFVSQGMRTYNCDEIALPSDENYTFSCVLSSMNASKYDEWKDTDAVFTATVLLDCVASEFIERAEKISGLEKVVRFTKDFRALGLGCLGFHTYLQKNNVAFEKLEANFINGSLFKHIREESYRASEWMAENWGQPKFCEGTKMRNATTMAIAPNMSSAVVCGSVSEGIQPFPSNAYTQKTAAGDLRRINPVLIDVLKSYDKYNDETIDDIIDHDGSVQHLDFLTDDEKLVFKTAFEINQKVIIRLAANRQKYIDQGQSLNLFFKADADEALVSEIHAEAFLNENIKALYYLRSQAGVQGAKDRSKDKNKAQNIAKPDEDEEECFACAG